MERFALIENLQRDDPNPVDTAHGLASYQKRFATAENPMGLSTSELAQRLGLDQTRVKRLLQLSAAPEGTGR